MRCWKCDQEIPKNLKYCSNCGAHTNRAVHFAKQLFSKKGLSVLLIAAALVLAGTILGLHLSTASPNTEASDPPGSESTDWISMLREDLYSEDSALTRAMAEAVTLKLVGESEEGITVEATCPDVYEGAIQWFMSVSDESYTDQALEAALLELLKGKTSTATFELPFDAEGSPYCTDTFLDAASGGVRKFYTALTAMLIEEMGASIHE